MDKIALNVDGTSGNEHLETEMAGLAVDVLELFKKKLKSYGTANISEFGEKGVVLRMNDKIKRLKNLVWEDMIDPLQDETAEDTYLDMAIYSLIAIIVRRGDWK